MVGKPTLMLTVGGIKRNKIRILRGKIVIEMTYHNDHKEKWQSHEVSIREHDFYNAEANLYSHDPFDIIGYGATKEEAIEDFKNKFRYIMREWKAFEMMLLDTDVITDGIIKVDCMGKEIKST